MANTFVKNFQMIIRNYPYNLQQIRVDSDDEWTSLMTLPEGMIEAQFRARYRGRAYIVGGWPIVVAFYSDDDHMQALMSL
jgi:hypothetical protein